MKRLTIIFAFALIPFLSKGQAYENAYGITRFWNNVGIGTRGSTLFDTSHYALQIGNSVLDKGMILPIATTSLVPVQGGFFYSPVDSSIYYSNGFNWTKVGSGGGGGLSASDLHDSLVANSVDVLFPLTLDASNKTLSADTTMKDSSLVNYRQMKQYVSTNAPTYTLPTASTTTLGGVKVDGSSITINGSGVISATTGGSGSVTSVGLSAPTGFSVSGSPVTTSGTLALNFASGYSLPTIANQTSWTNKVNISDSSAMLAPYAFKSSLGQYKLNSDSVSLTGYVSHNAMNDTLSGKIIMNTPTDSVSLNGNNLSTTDQSITGDRDIDLNGHTLQINDKTQSYPGSGGLFSNSWVQLSLADGGGHSNATVSLNNPLSPNVQITAQGYNSGSIPTIYTQDSSGFKWSINNTASNIAQLYTNGSLQLTNSLVAASASISGNVSASGINSTSFINVNGSLDYNYKIISANYTIITTDLVIIDTTNTSITLTLTDGTAFNGGKIIIVRNKGTGSITLTNMANGEGSTVSANTSAILINTNLGWIWLH